MCVAHSALPMYNAALNKPAYQSSVHVNPTYGSYNASLANDGIRETHAVKDNKARCSISQRETNPWWAVDLGRPTTVYRVDLTNRGDSGSYAQYTHAIKWRHKMAPFYGVCVLGITDVILFGVIIWICSFFTCTSLRCPI